MAEKGLDALLQFSPSNLFYLTGYNTAGFNNWQCLVVPMKGNPVLVLRLLERPIALATSWTDSIETYQDHEEPEAAVARTLSDLGLSNASLGAEQTSPFLTVGSYNNLNGLVGGRLVDGTGIVESVRLIKSDLELDYFRRAARSTEAGMQAAVDAIAEGRTENDVAAASYEAMTATGGEFFCNSPIVTTGYKSGLAHTTYHRRTLERGDPVAIEIGATFNRYTSPLFRTAAVGEASPDLRRMYEACTEALEAAIEVIKPGPDRVTSRRPARESSTPAASSPTSGKGLATASALATHPRGAKDTSSTSSTTTNGCSSPIWFSMSSLRSERMANTG